jgi:hypothetical protein
MASNFQNTITNFLLQQFKDDNEDEEMNIYKTYNPEDDSIEQSFTEGEEITKIHGEY